jgi:hypothetical protein
MRLSLMKYLWNKTMSVWGAVSAVAGVIVLIILLIVLFRLI